PADNLRRRATEKAKADDDVRPEETLSPAETQRLLHELRVHQIELEMQNEELRQAQVDLEASRARYFDLYDLAPIGYVTVSDKGMILEANLAAANLLGVERRSLAGQPLTRFIVVDDQDIYYRHRRQLFETGAPQACELRMLRADAAPFWARLNATAAQDVDGAPVCRVVMADITERKQAEAALRESEERLRQVEKMDAIGQLAGGIAHDFNNQLTGVLGYADLLYDRLDDVRLKRYAENIRTAARRSADLTAKLLAFARKGQYLSVPVDMHHLVAEAVAILQHSIDKRIHLELLLRANATVVTGDPSQLENALLNLGLNARDAMPDGGTLTFETQVAYLDAATCAKHPGELQPGDYLQLTVTDTGHGMSDEVKQHLFEPFFTTKPVGKGTGMGLAAVYGTIGNHRGAITASSTVGCGTTFTIYLPLDKKSARPSTPDSDVTAPTLAKLRVLVVDDEGLVRDLVSEILRNDGHTVTTAANGREALDIYRQHWQELDLVILDMVMPVLDGRDTFRGMKAINPGVRALLSSGFSVDNEAKAILNEGALGFVGKPFRRHELMTLIAQVTKTER
ncbi:MAG: hypothetical protein A3K19_05100, partial [Lentisphaerae bacterium RIFOXYB12_FULL_65_16]